MGMDTPTVTTGTTGTTGTTTGTTTTCTDTTCSTTNGPACPDTEGTSWTIRWSKDPTTTARGPLRLMLTPSISPTGTDTPTLDPTSDLTGTTGTTTGTTTTCTDTTCSTTNGPGCPDTRTTGTETTTSSTITISRYLLTPILQEIRSSMEKLDQLFDIGYRIKKFRSIKYFYGIWYSYLVGDGRHYLSITRTSLRI